MNPEKTKVILIGNAEYPVWGNEKDDPKIPNVKENLKMLKEIFLSDLFGIKQDEDHLLELPEMKSDEILETVSRSLKKTRGLMETLIFYYSGHGIPHQQKGLFLTTNNTKWDSYEYNSIQASELKELIENSGIPEKIVIIDCCHAEGFSKGKMGTVQSQFEQAVPVINGTFSIFSSAWDNSAKFPTDQPEMPTYFTKALIDTFNEGKPGGGDYLKADDIYEQLCLKLDQLRNVDDSEIPHPVPKIDGEAGNFFVCKNKKYQPALIEEEIELNKIKVNPNRPAIRDWQKKFPNNRKLQEESRKLLRMIDDAETEIEDVLKIDAKERKRTLLDLADKFADWKDMYDIVMNLYDSAVAEAKQLNATSPLSKVESASAPKTDTAKKPMSLLQKEENRKAGSPEDNLPSSDASTNMGEENTPNLNAPVKENISSENQNARSANILKP